MNPRSMKLFRRKNGNAIDFNGAISGCPTCTLGKSQQNTHPKKPIHKTTGPMELVYTDLMEPIILAAMGCYLYVDKSTDEFKRIKEIVFVQD